LGPTVLRFVTWLSVALFSQVIVAFQDSPAGIWMYPRGPL